MAIERWLAMGANPRVAIVRALGENPRKATEFDADPEEFLYIWMGECFDVCLEIVVFGNNSPSTSLEISGITLSD
jgi:hypothetical protein